MSFNCIPKRHILGRGDFVTRPNRAVNLYNPAKTKGDAVVGLLAHCCSVSTKTVLVSNRGVLSIRRSDLHRRINVILRRPFLFSSAILGGLHCTHLRTDRTSYVRTTGRTGTRSFVLHLPRNCSALLARQNDGLDRNRHRLLAVTHVVITGPHLIVLSRTADGISAHARTGVRRTLGHLVTKHADFIVTRHLDAVHRTSGVLILGTKTLIRRNARSRLLSLHKLCCSLCADRFGNGILAP